MLKLFSARATLAAALVLATVPASAAEEKWGPLADDTHASGSARQGHPSFGHVHALAVTLTAGPCSWARTQGSSGARTGAAPGSRWRCLPSIIHLWT